MASMSYCRWRNALNEVRAAVEAFYNGESVDMPKEEKKAMSHLVQEVANLIESEGGSVDLGDVQQSIENGVSASYDSEDNWEDEDFD